MKVHEGISRSTLTTCVVAVALGASAPTWAQTSENGRAVPIVRDSVASDLMPALHTVRPVPPPIDGVRELPRKTLPGRVGSAAPAGVTETLVSENAPVGVSGSVGVGFDGVSNVNGVLPPDPTGAIGPYHYVQAVNLSFAIYDRAGTRVYGPASTNTIWNGFGGPCQNTNNGDPVVLYDREASRFVISQFALPNYPTGPFYQCIAVSQSWDPTGAWYRYAFLISNTKMNDYPKLAVWPDGYYMSVNQFNQSTLSWGGAGAVVFERDKMLNGQTARMIYFDLYSVNANLGGMLPSDWDGATAPPVGSPNVFAEIDDDAWGYSGDQIWLWQFHADWTTPANSTMSSLATLATSPFDANMCGYARACIPQPGTSAKLDALSDRLMFRLAYRNFGDHQSLVLNHTVDTNGANRAGIRWYELRDTGSGWGIHQQGTHAPADGQHRWMGSIAMNDNGDMALAYSVSGSTVSPSLRFTSRAATDALGQMTQPETSIVAGSGYQTHSASRWGDYAHLSADPLPGEENSLWFTGEYTNSASSASWKTRIAKIVLSDLPPPPPVYSHVGDLDRSTTVVRKGWRAHVTVTIHDAAHAAVPNATVSGTWSGGYTAGGSCVTNTSGQCVISTGTMNNRKLSATLTMTAVSHATYAYEQASNHDADGESNGTAITVSKP